MTPKQRKLAYDLLTNPPGRDIAAAKEYGIDLTLLVENLDLTVAERLRKLYSVATFLEKMRKPAIPSPAARCSTGPPLPV